MGDYVKRPVTVTAWRFDPTSTDSGTATWQLEPRCVASISVRDDGTYGLWVQKSKAWCDLEPGDYIVAEPDGLGVYPCKRAIFEASHDPLPEKTDGPVESGESDGR